MLEFILFLLYDRVVIGMMALSGGYHMILAAISHSATKKDCFCMEPGRFRFRLRTAKDDIEEVVLHYQDKYLPLQVKDTRAEIQMTRFASDAALDYWEAEISFQVVCLRYWFSLKDTNGNTVFYSNYLFSQEPFFAVDDMFDCPQNLREEERFQTPEWAENKILYQVFPSRFASSRPVPSQVWYKSPIGFSDDLHGDLRGLIARLDHLRELGVDILYMTPIFRSNSCHKYDTIDYYTVEPSFGTKEDLKELVDKAHDMGMKVILDGVFNHTSPDFFAFADIRKNEWHSPYIDWYFIEGFPLRANRGEKPNYKTFSYFGGMPKLNLKNPEVARYVTDVALYWLRECGIDGWRLDVGDEISHVFWRNFRREIKAEFPDALIIGEVWHLAEDFLQGDEWDTVMNYPFYQNVLRLGAWETITPSQFAQNLDLIFGQLHPKVPPLLWNLVDSHDTPRLLHQCKGSKPKMRLVAALQLLMPGMPMIYYGDEYAMDGGQDPDCRRGMVWEESRQDRNMFAWYKSLIALRKHHPGILSRRIFETDDEKGLLIQKTEMYTLIFHCRKGTFALPEFAGKKELITGKAFSGKLGPYQVLVFQNP